VELALLPLDASALARPERIFEAWEAAFVPLTPTWLRAALDLAPADTGVTLSGEGLVFSSLKPAESGSGVVLRAFNARPDTVRGTIRFAHPVRRVRRSAADERDGPDLPLGALGTSIDVTVRGGDLVTLLID
jgi:alpha-mannosidase